MQNSSRTYRNETYDGLVPETYNKVEIDLFVYINDQSALKHRFFVDYYDQHNWIKTWVIDDMPISQVRGLIMSTMSTRQISSLNGLYSRKRGYDDKGFLGEKHSQEIRREILASTALKKNIDYLSNHHDYTPNRIQEYVVQNLV